MDQLSPYYKELNLPLLKVYAKNWGKRYPCIERIALYLAGPENDGYDLQYVLVANAPEYNKRKFPEDESKWTAEDESDWEIREYRNWAQGIDVRADELGKVYKGDPPIHYNFQWMWYELKNGERIEGYNNFSGEDFVLLDTEFVLYENEAYKQKSDPLFLKYCKLARQFCEDRIDKREQLASRKEIKEYLAKCLEESKESLGPNSRLPTPTFRDMGAALLEH